MEEPLLAGSVGVAVQGRGLIAWGAEPRPSGEKLHVLVGAFCDLKRDEVRWTFENIDSKIGLTLTDNTLK